MLLGEGNPVVVVVEVVVELAAGVVATSITGGLRVSRRVLGLTTPHGTKAGRARARRTIWDPRPPRRPGMTTQGY